MLIIQAHAKHGLTRQFCTDSVLWLSYKSLTSWSAWYSSRYTAKPRLVSLAMDKGTGYKLRENVHLGIPFTGGIHICQPNWGYR